MKIPFLDLSRAYEAFADEFDARLRAVSRSGSYVLGDNVAAFEEMAAAYLGVDHTIAVGSGTDALHLALAALEIGDGDEVITSPFTFAATVEAIEYVGAQAVLVDIDPDTHNIDPQRIEDAITPATRAIIPVHLFGLPAAMPPIMEIANRCDLVVVEDCAQSFGAAIATQRVGAIGDAGAHSFYPTKTMGCLGDGGLISTRDGAVAQRLRELRNHGIGAGGEHIRLGFNSRLDEVQAAILRHKLAHIDDSNERRRTIARHYSQALSAAGARTPVESAGAHHVYGYYTIMVDDRDRLRARLQDAGVSTALYYSKPLHRHEYFSRTCRFGELVVAENAASRCLSLPIFPEMTDAEVDYVAKTTAALLQ